MKAKPMSLQSVPSNSKPKKTTVKAKPASATPVKRLGKMTKNRIPDAPQFEHPRLTHKYPIIEVAALAAAFRSNDHEKGLESAIDMLAMIEQMSFLPMETMIRNESRRLRGPVADDLPPESQKKIADRYRSRQQLLPKCVEILKACERDEKSGKVKRASLIAEVCKDVKGVGSPAYDPEVFNEWLDSMKQHPNDDPRSLGTHGFRYESARRIKLIQDDDAAFHLIAGFHQWLSKRRNGKTPPRSKKTGTYVSNSTKGTVLDEKKKFQKK